MGTGQHVCYDCGKNWNDDTGYCKECQWKGEIVKANEEYTSPAEFFEWCADNDVTDTELDNIKDIPHEGRELNQWIYLNIK